MNTLYPNFGKGLLDLIGDPQPQTSLTNYPNALSSFGSLSPLAPLTVAELLRSYSPSPPAPRVPVQPAINALMAPAVKRKVYFAFDFDDLMRVNNVRQIGKIGPREQRNARTFCDRSIWENRNIKNEQNLKNLMREAVRHSSVVCALIGTSTWQARWAKYEIARSVADEKGLLAVHINSIKNTTRQVADPLGINPLHMMGIYRSETRNYFLYERQVVVVNAATAEMGFEWRLYEDFSGPVPLPRYIPCVDVGHVVPLSWYIREYDMCRDEGFKNIGAWIDAAAAQVGR